LKELGEFRFRGEYLDLSVRKWLEAVEDCRRRSFVTCTLHQMLLEDKIKVVEMSGTYSTDGRVKKRVLCLGWKTGREETA
jgi:hypothetical protein